MPAVWVFHRGALGDSVLLWPMLRHLVRSGERVVLVTDRAKAALAEREIGVVGIDAEQRRFNDLWREDAAIEPVPGVARVVDHTGGEGLFARNLRAMFPGALINAEPPPRARQSAAYADAHPLAAVTVRDNPGGPIVAHVGAGSDAKRWPMVRWVELLNRLAERRPVAAIAGEVEAEKFDADDRVAFGVLRGRFIPDLPDLVVELKRARLFIGADCGPTHLAAQLGIPTLALFGPSSPADWSPVGPMVTVLAPDAPSPMEWLEPARVLTALPGL